MRYQSCITFTRFIRRANTSVRPIPCASDHPFDSYRRAILEWGHYHLDLSQSAPQLEGSPHRELNFPGHEGGLAALLSSG